MKEDKVIELGYEFCIDSGDECFEFGKNDLQALINHVEKATLERAAKHFDKYSAHLPEYALAAESLREMKDSND